MKNEYFKQSLQRARDRAQLHSSDSVWMNSFVLNSHRPFDDPSQRVFIECSRSPLTHLTIHSNTPKRHEYFIAEMHENHDSSVVQTFVHVEGKSISVNIFDDSEGCIKVYSFSNHCQFVCRSSKFIDLDVVYPDQFTNGWIRSYLLKELQSALTSHTSLRAELDSLDGTPLFDIVESIKKDLEKAN